MTATEVAERLDCGADPARSRLDALAVDGSLARRTVDGTPVWWRPQRSASDEAGFSRDRERLDFVVENSPLVLFGLDTGLRYTWVENPHPDFEEASVVGKRDEDLLPPAAARAVSAPKRRALETGERVREEVSYELPSGPVTYDLTIEPFRDEAGDIAGLACLSFDVTERKQNERELERRTAELEALNRLIRHDIRNDMAVMLGWAETLEDHVDDEGRQSLDRILRSGRHVVDLTEGARDAIEALVGGSDADLEPTPLSQTLHTEIDLLREAYPALTVEVDDVPDVSVHADAMLGSAFKNVLDNAVRHSDRDHPTVEVGCSLDPSLVELRISDDGPGIPDDRKESVFEKGNRGEHSTGTGIGLYVVRTLVDRYGGDVWIEDNEPRGATFVVRLPRAD
ncbi:hypothetical protein JCM30237_18630 [Halolamina litorea]